MPKKIATSTLRHEERDHVTLIKCSGTPRITSDQYNRLVTALFRLTTYLICDHQLRTETSKVLLIGQKEVRSPLTIVTNIVNSAHQTLN